MSLINEALKKAQRQRLDGGAESADPSSPTGERVVRRGKPQNSNSVVLLGTAGLVLVVLSVVFTVYLVNRPSDTKRVAATSASPAASVKSPAISSPTTSAPIESAPPIVVPTITPPVTAPVPSPAAATDSSRTTTTPAAVPAPATVAPRSPSTAPTSANSPAATGSITASATTAPVITAPMPAPDASPGTAPAAAPAPAATSLPPGTPDERVAAFVESIRVTGIRSSGAESRVLMNERVYRVNDVVERNLGVRLVKAAADSLTFSDPRGVTYVKNF